MSLQPIRRSCSFHDHSPRSSFRLVLQCLDAASLLSAEGGVVLLRKCALGWTNEQRASAAFADVAYVPSVGNTKTSNARSSSDAPVCVRWNGLPPPRSVLLCSAGPLTTVSAATCGPLLALPHNDRFDGRHFCGAGSCMAATTRYGWRAKPVSTCVPGAPARRSGSVQPLYGGDS